MGVDRLAFRQLDNTPVGVDHTGVIVAHALTDATGDDATTGVELIEAVNDDIASVTADAVRHGWLLRCGRCTGRDRRGPADQDGQGVPTEAAVERS